MLHGAVSRTTVRLPGACPLSADHRWVWPAGPMRHPALQFSILLHGGRRWTSLRPPRNAARLKGMVTRSAEVHHLPASCNLQHGTAWSRSDHTHPDSRCGDGGIVKIGNAGSWVEKINLSISGLSELEISLRKKIRGERADIILPYASREREPPISLSSNGLSSDIHRNSRDHYINVRRWPAILQQALRSCHGSHRPPSRGHLVRLEHAKPGEKFRDPVGILSHPFCRFMK